MRSHRSELVRRSGYGGGDNRIMDLCGGGGAGWGVDGCAGIERTATRDDRATIKGRRNCTTGHIAKERSDARTARPLPRVRRGGCRFGRGTTIEKGIRGRGDSAKSGGSGRERLRSGEVAVEGRVGCGWLPSCQCQMKESRY